MIHDEADDIVMVDVEDAATIETIASGISQRRNEVPLRQRRSRFDTTRQILPANVEGIFLIDTNFIISHLSIIKTLVDRYSTSKMLVLVPWVVIQELDGLKSAPNDHGQTNLATLARSAISYIHDCLAREVVGLRGQRLTESLEPDQFGDDAIVDCALYWAERQELRPILLSNDKNLCSKVLIHGITTVSFELGLTGRKILDQVARLYGNLQSESMIVDESSATMDTIEDHGKTTIHESSEMDTDAIVAGFYHAKQMPEDPFERLAQKAGHSIYANHTSSAQYLTNSAEPPVRGRRQSLASARQQSFSRSSSPMDTAASVFRVSSTARQCRSGSSDAKKTSFATNQPLSGLLSDVCETLIDALPPLLQSHMEKEIGDPESVRFLMHDVNGSIQAITQFMYANWFLCLGRVLRAFSTRKDHLKVVSNDLVELSSSRRPRHDKVKTTVEAWSSIWKELAKDVQGRTYLAMQEEKIKSWLDLL